MFMAGAGIKGGQVIGSTDEIGLKAVEERAHIHDIHASILRVLGLNHHKTTFPHDGRLERATINGGNLIDGIVD
jgi:hypothetical protein